MRSSAPRTSYECAHVTASSWFASHHGSAGCMPVLCAKASQRGIGAGGAVGRGPVGGDGAAGGHSGRHGGGGGVPLRMASSHSHSSGKPSSHTPRRARAAQSGRPTAPARGRASGHAARGNPRCGSQGASSHPGACPAPATRLDSRRSDRAEAAARTSASCAGALGGARPAAPRARSARP
eukprot:scaffold71739_cov69-Phaeocystis_antarctica.AAC.5